MSEKVVLLILDGWGYSDEPEWNAITQGKTPVFDLLNNDAKHTLISASGVEVGLPKGQMGNSEVGHLNIGAGRVVFQDLLRISNAIKNGSFKENLVLQSAFKRARQNDSSVHLCGLLSNGGVHSHIEHLYSYLEMGKSLGVDKIFVHAFTDGRDTPTDSGLGFIQDLEQAMGRIGVGRIATITGRFYAMDRDNRWDRIKRTYNLLIHGEGASYKSPLEIMKQNYERCVTDEFIEPSLVVPVGEAPRLIREDDEIMMFNFRADRMREIVRSLHKPEFSAFNRRGGSVYSVTCLTEYDEKFSLPVAFEGEKLKMGLGQTISENGLRQFRTAETEKYAHVTFFFNGGIETPFSGESRKLVPSPKVNTYDLKPEMSCKEVTDLVVKAIGQGEDDLIVANLANGDMVGHTGNWEAAIHAVKTIDSSVGRIVKASNAIDAHLLITADHGNIEMMKYNNKPMTAHTGNLVPFYYVGKAPYKLCDGGRLADIAPTVLKLIGAKIPEQMTGVPLLD